MTQPRILIVGHSDSITKQIQSQLLEAIAIQDTGYNVEVVYDNDVSSWVEHLSEDPHLKGVLFDTRSIKEDSMGLWRKTRKDLFAVGIQVSDLDTNSGRYVQALELLKRHSLNLVLSMDRNTGASLIAAPEETRYAEHEDGNVTMAFLMKMMLARMKNRFTRSTVLESDLVDWNSTAVPENLRSVVNHCIDRGAYKPVLGKTAGHFAVKVDGQNILTSIRKSNFNQLDRVGLVRVESVDDDSVRAYGARPSVGGQSQRKIFAQHPETNIVHFHCPVKADAPMRGAIPVKDQWPNECGSHECGQNTSDGLRVIDLGDGDSLKVVFLDSHGPNIVFSASTPAFKVEAFIDANFDLSAKTGGLVV